MFVVIDLLHEGPLLNCSASLDITSIHFCSTVQMSVNRLRCQKHGGGRSKTLNYAPPTEIKTTDMAADASCSYSVYQNSDIKIGKIG